MSPTVKALPSSVWAAAVFSGALRYSKYWPPGGSK